MAETSLPSRETIGEAVTFAHITDSDGDHLIDIAQAYVEGRLVDREAIDREGARATAADVLHCDVSTPEIDLILDAAFVVIDE